jgi:PAS domain S-box-containing protein
MTRSQHWRGAASQSEELFRLVAENVEDFAIFAIDLDGNNASWNPGVEKLLGYTEDEWIGRDSCIIFTPEDNEQGACALEMRVAAERGRAEDERWHLRKDGSRFWTNGLMMSLRDDSGSLRGFAKVMRDDTERKLTEDRLRESEARFERLVNLSPDAVVVHTEGVVLFINAAGAKLLRADGPDQIIGKPVGKFLHPDYHEIVRERIEKMKRGETLSPMEMKFIRIDGTEVYGEVASVPFLYQGKPAVQAVVRDLTRRKEAEETLRESEKRFRLIFNQQFQFMAILSPEGVLLDVNELPLRATGTTREQVLGRLFWETPWWNNLPEMQAGWPARLAHAARSDGPVFSVDFYQAADGTRIADASITAIKDSDGRVQFFIVQASDITERKRIEEERERLLLEAQQANQLKDEFLATLSHELRTPLTSILGWARLLQTTNFDEAAAKRALGTIERNARTQTQLIDDLLDVSRIITGKLRLDIRAVDLAAVIRTAADTLRPAAEAKNIHLQTSLDPQAVPISGDPDRLQQVVWNLISNAIKFTPNDGRVQVKLERVNAHVEITVSDTGKGISKDFLPHVFDRFRQADQTSTRTHGGLGLGLAIVRQLVELHGGSVQVESAGEEQGATFTVSLPLLPLPAMHDERTEEAHQVYPEVKSEKRLDCVPELSGLRVLVVDDEPDTRELIVTVLSSCGAQVASAASTPKALEMIDREQFDVLVTDIGMPEEDGYSLINKVRALPIERGGQMPAAALTAYARAEDRLRALNSGFQMHVTKPIDPAELIIVVASLAGRSTISA